MNSLLKYFILAFGLVLIFAASPAAIAQKKSKSKKQIQKEQGKKGHDGLIIGAVNERNAEREYLLSRQQALDMQRQNGFSTGAGKSMPQVNYEGANKRFKVKEYENKNAKLKRKKKPKRLIDQDNPNGKMYQEAVRKRERKFLVF